MSSHKRILVTGGAGFIGSNLVDHLIDRGHYVEAIDDYSLGKPEHVAHLRNSDRFAMHELSILDPAFYDVMARGQYDAVFHMAANSDISAGSKDRQVDLDRTFLTTFHVCEAMARTQTRQLLLASTSAIYGETAAPTDEDHGPLEPVSFYGAAKLASEAYCCAFAHRMDMQTFVYRFPNVVGPRATHGVIYDFINKLRATPHQLDVLGDGSQNKPYLYVHDLCDAMLAVWDRGKAQPVGVYNIAPGSFTTVAEIAEIVRDEMGLAESAEIVFGEGNRGWPGDVPWFDYVTDKIAGLGWSPSRDSNGAVRQTVKDLLS